MAAIDRGIADAGEGLVVPLEEVRKLVPQWISKFASPKLVAQTCSLSLRLFVRHHGKRRAVQEQIRATLLFNRPSSSLLAAYRRSIPFLFGWHMSSEDLGQLVSELSPAEQSAVKEFIAFLKERNGKSPETSFQAAIDEFIGAHPELLRRLAQ
jgi:hypothetical protein